MPATVTPDPVALPQRQRLDNGIVLIGVRNPMAEITAGRLCFAGGSRVEDPRQAGLANLMAAVLTKGTPSYDAQDIATLVESLGASLGCDSSSDYFEISFKCLAEDLGALLAIVAEIVRHPSFPEAEVERERDLMLQAILAQQERPFSLGLERIRPLLYPNHPYGQPLIGWVETVSSLSRADLVAYHQRHFRPDRMVLAVVGPQEAEPLVERVAAAFGNWSAPSDPPPVEPAPPLARPQRSQLLKLSQATQQSVVMVGYQGAAASSPDYATLKLLSCYLGNGLSSRLFVELREKRGLAYEVSALFVTRQDPAPFVAYLGTAPENTATALSELLAELRRLSERPLDPEEVETAQRKLLGQQALSKQTNAQIAQLLSWYEVLGLGLEFDQAFGARLRAVTANEIQAVAQRYLTNPIVSLVGPGLDDVADPFS